MQSARSPATQMSMPAGHCAHVSRVQPRYQGSLPQHSWLKSYTKMCSGPRKAYYPLRSAYTLHNAAAAQQHY